MSANQMQEQVNEICNDLYSKGQKISVRLILSELPNVSSTSTVHKYYANWRRELVANEKSLYEKLGFSSEFTQIFMKEISRFSIEAEERYKSMADDALEQRDAAIDELSKIEDKFHKQSAVVEQQEKEIVQLKYDLKTNENGFEADKEKLAESHDVLVTELRQRIVQLEAELNEANASSESLRTDLAKAELRLEGNQNLVDEVKSKQEQLEAGNSHLQTENQDLSKQITKLSMKLESAESVNELLKRQASGFEASNRELLSKVSELEANHKTSHSELTESKGQIQAQNEKIGALQELNKQQKKYISNLEAEVKRLEGGKESAAKK